MSDLHDADGENGDSFFEFVRETSVAMCHLIEGSISIDEKKEEKIEATEQSEGPKTTHEAPFLSRPLRSVRFLAEQLYCKEGNIIDLLPFGANAWISADVSSSEANKTIFYRVYCFTVFLLLLFFSFLFFFFNFFYFSVFLSPSVGYIFFHPSFDC